MNKIAIIGGGSWATAIVKILTEIGENTPSIKINWWLREQDSVKHIRQFGHNPEYLSDVEIDLSRVNPTGNIQEALSDSDFIFIVTPSAFIKSVLEGVDKKLFENKIVVSAAKGMIPEMNLLPTEYLKEVFAVKDENVCAIVGPCHAEEVALERQSYLTIACSEIKNAQKVVSLLECRYVKCSTIDDVLGTEFCAVMKNITAIACGISHGVGYGDNYQAVLVSNALQEMERFLNTADPKPRNLSNSAYLGDLLVTSYSQFSRNRTFGNMVGRGYSVKSAQMEMTMIAEGYYAVKCIYEINQKYGVNMPITTAVYHVLYERITPRVEFKLLSQSIS